MLQLFFRQKENNFPILVKSIKLIKQKSLKTSSTLVKI